MQWELSKKHAQMSLHHAIFSSVICSLLRCMCVCGFKTREIKTLHLKKSRKNFKTEKSQKSRNLLHEGQMHLRNWGIPGQSIESKLCVYTGTIAKYSVFQRNFRAPSVTLVLYYKFTEEETRRICRWKISEKLPKSFHFRQLRSGQQQEAAGWEDKLVING